MLSVSLYHTIQLPMITVDVGLLGHSSFSFAERVANVNFAEILRDAIEVTGYFGLTTRPTGSLC